jgi:organic radical activating enzyme
MKPNPNNACSGKYDDWLEVNLINKCNANCSWCIEKNGYHPKKIVDWETIAKAAITLNKTNIILLGGEPTLYSNLKELIDILYNANKAVWITTNGSKLTKDFIENKLDKLTGINISIHHYNLFKNYDITGIQLSFQNLKEAVDELLNRNIKIRLNCNCIKNQIDSIDEIHKYLDFAKSLNITNVRFAELKNDINNFVNLSTLFPEYLTNEPFVNGCSVDVVIKDINVNFRIMCGLQTPMRILPYNPEQKLHGVLYYDGKIYKGWQTDMDPREKQMQKNIKLLAREIYDKNLKLDEIEQAIFEFLEKNKEPVEEVSGCVY